jgi:hypothetical protein
VRHAAGVFRRAGEALKAALDLAAAVRLENWPCASEDVDDNLADRLATLTEQQDRAAPKWTVEERFELAEDLGDGAAQGAWARAMCAGRVEPSPEYRRGRGAVKPPAREPGDDDPDVAGAGGI